MVRDAAETQLRSRLVAQLKGSGYIRSARVERAFSLVPRHLFVPPGIPPAEAYRDEVIPLVPGLATLSQPSIVAIMLEELDAAPGCSTLEVGTASGYNAALLAEIVEDPALVHTMEIEPALARQAAKNLARAGYAEVNVRTGDGTLGWPERAPFSRIMITAEATDLSRQLLAQVEEAGSLLAPFAVPGLSALLLRLHKRAGRLSGEFVGVPVAFVPLRGRYGADRRKEARSARAEEAVWAVEHAILRQRAVLTLEQRLAFGLIAVALAERTGPGDREELSATAWATFAEAGKPGLADLTVSAVLTNEACPGQLAFKREELAFCLDLSGQRNPVGGSESRRQEDLR